MFVVLGALEVIPLFHGEELALAVVDEVPIVSQLVLQELDLTMLLKAVALDLELLQLPLREARDFGERLLEVVLVAARATSLIDLRWIGL